MTQRERVLQMLEAAGDDGVTTAQFLEAHIPRFSARIGELRSEGHPIHTKRLRTGSFLFKLVRQPLPLADEQTPVPGPAASCQVPSSVRSPDSRGGAGVDFSLAAVGSISTEAAEDKGERVASGQESGAARLFEIEEPTGHHQVEAA